MYTESHSRSIAKAVTWRILGTVTTSLLVFIFTRRVVLSLAVGGLEFISKIGLFWMHERVWDRVRVGRRSQQPAVIWLTGLSGSGKSTLAERVASQLERLGYRVEHLDGDTIRTIFPQTGFTRKDRNDHIKRAGYLASRLEQHGVFVVASLISPYEESRDFVRDLCDNFFEIYVSTPLEECERRDSKGLYARARRGELKGFTGIDDPYEPPRNPELTIDLTNVSPDTAAALVMKRIRETKRSGNGAAERPRSTKHSHSARSLRELQTAGDAVVDREG